MKVAAIAWYCLIVWTLASSADVIRFDTEGGDAWTYLKTVTGTFDTTVCDEVLVSAPHGHVVAERANERFIARVPLRAGTNRLIASCHRDGRERSRSAPQQWQVKLPDVPKARVRLLGHNELNAEGSELAPGSPTPLTRYRWRLGELSPYFDSAGPIGHMPLPEGDAEHVLQVQVEDARGRTDVGAALLGIKDGRARMIDTAREHADWIDSAVLYGVVPFFFGGFDGVRDRLDEIAALGATAIWISPVTATTPDDFGYGPVDHFRLRDTFGNEAAFRTLVQAAHTLGLKVILDFVPNHVANGHPYFLNAQALGRRSPYFDWFDRDARGDITHYFDWTHLHNLNFDHPEVRNYTVAAFAHWLHGFAVDGFRVDAAWGVTQRAPDFWHRWREEMKRIEPQSLLLAEASERDAAAFDAAYDWSAQIGEWAWRDVFHDASTVPDLDRLRESLSQPRKLLTLRFINNNDTGERFISRFGLAHARLAATLTFTLPGIPLIYNGDEVGAAFEPYAEGPPIEWHDPHGLTEHYRELAHVRRKLPALRTNALTIVNTPQDERVLAFVRPMPRCEEEVLVVMNFSAQKTRVRLPASRFGRRLRDALSGNVHVVDAKRPQLEMKPHEALLLNADDCARTKGT